MPEPVMPNHNPPRMWANMDNISPQHFQAYISWLNLQLVKHRIDLAEASYAKAYGYENTTLAQFNGVHGSATELQKLQSAISYYLDTLDFAMDVIVVLDAENEKTTVMQRLIKDTLTRLGNILGNHAQGFQLIVLSNESLTKLTEHLHHCAGQVDLYSESLEYFWEMYKVAQNNYLATARPSLNVNRFFNKLPTAGMIVGAGVSVATGFGPLAFLGTVIAGGVSGWVAQTVTKPRIPLRSM